MALSSTTKTTGTAREVELALLVLPPLRALAGLSPVRGALRLGSLPFRATTARNREREEEDEEIKNSETEAGIEREKTTERDKHTAKLMALSSTTKTTGTAIVVELALLVLPPPLLTLAGLSPVRGALRSGSLPFRATAAPSECTLRSLRMKARVGVRFPLPGLGVDVGLVNDASWVFAVALNPRPLRADKREGMGKLLLALSFSHFCVCGQFLPCLLSTGVP